MAAVTVSTGDLWRESVQERGNGKKGGNRKRGWRYVKGISCTGGTTDKNSTLRYECDETFSDECEFAARAEGE